MDIDERWLANSSLAAMLLLITIAIRRKPRVLIATVAATTILVGIAASIFDPFYDHNFYIGLASQALADGGMLSNIGQNITPYVNALALSTKLLGPNYGFYLANIVFLSALILVISFNFGGSNFRVVNWPRRVLLSILAFICLPTCLALIASANKDLLIAFALLICFLGIMSLGDAVASRRAVTLKALAKNGSQIIAAAIILRMQRPYFFNFVLSFSFFAFLLVWVCRINFSKGIIFLVATCGSFAAGAVTLYALGGSIKTIEAAYLGRATVHSLYGVRVQSLFEALKYSILAVYEGYFAMFFAPFWATSIGIMNLIAGFADQLVFLIALIVLVFNKKLSIFCKSFVVSIVIYHCIVQLFGSPNYGAFFRLRFAIYVCLLAAIFNQRSYAIRAHLPTKEQSEKSCKKYKSISDASIRP